MGLDVRLQDGTLIDLNQVLFIRPNNNLEEPKTYYAVFQMTTRRIHEEDYEFLSRLTRTPKELWETRFRMDCAYQEMQKKEARGDFKGSL